MSRHRCTQRTLMSACDLLSSYVKLIITPSRQLLLLLWLCFSGVGSLMAQCDFTCISQVHHSLDQNCEATITVESLLSNYSNTVPSDFTLILKDEDDQDLTSNTVGIEYLNQNLTYELINNLTGCNLACWGHVLIEYKFLPTIDCPANLTLSCGALEVLPLPDVSGGSGCVTTALSIYLANETRQKIECNDPGFMDFTYLVNRTYEATDGRGNTASCEQQIYLRRPDFSNILFPTGTTNISCSDLDNYILYTNPDGVAIPIPWITATGSGTGSGTVVSDPGVPFVCEPSGVYATLGFCNATGSGTGSGSPLIPPSGASLTTLENGTQLVDGETTVLCNSVVQYTDMVVPTNPNDCKTKVYRTWGIREWFCGGEIQEGPHVQLIEISDDTAPEFVCPADYTVTTDEDCGGLVTLPSITNAMDACGHGVNVRTSFPNGIIEGNGGEAQLTPGDNLVTYIVSDNCQNSDECSINVTVKDWTEPVAICELNTVVALTDTGEAVVYASTFDNGSWDECGLANMQVRRMSTDCNLDDLDLGPYLTFCCSDLTADVMVLLRVFDLGGNYSDCMVNVDVQDQTTPAITCPADMTVDCKTIYALDNLGLSFDVATATDNCMSNFTYSESTSGSTNQCGVGELIRTINLVHNTTAEVVASCKQNLLFTDMTPFTASEIVWPTNLLHLNTGRCSVADLLPSSLDPPHNVPTFPTQEDHCSLLGYDYDDVITGEGGCIKITRTWKVIDWCTQVNGEFAIYTNPIDQEIEIISTTVPVIELSADPIEFSSNDIDCLNADVDVTVVATNVCSDGLVWSYIVRDLGGNIMNSGTGNQLTETFVASNYTIEWTVTSACGLTGTATQGLIVTNTKPPSPVCMSSMIVNLVGGTAVLETSMINVGSYSSCSNPITISFSDTDLSLVSIPYTCANLGTVTEQLWVTDLVNGAQDFCTTQITVVEDPNLPCDMTSGRVVVAGNVFTEKLESVEAVELSLASTMTNAMTDQEGKYAFDHMPMGGDYVLSPLKDDDHLNGVSTLDLILIQRHVLGLELLDSPYQLIAADINKSESINGLDLVELRKLILGIYTEFPANTSWRFIDENYSFVDQQNPWKQAIDETYLIENIASDMTIDFVGVKIGDVNGTAISSKENRIDTRSQRWPLVFEVEQRKLTAGSTNLVGITAQNYERVSGWQGTLEFDPSKVVIFGVVSDNNKIDEENFDLSQAHEGYITFSFGSTELQDIASTNQLFSLEILANKNLNTTDLFAVTSRKTPAEAYRGFAEVVPLEMRSTHTPGQVLKVQPNPWIEQTEILFNMKEAGMAKWEFFDAQGQLIYKYIQHYPEGKNRLRVDKSDLNVRGVIYMVLTTSDDIFKSKMVKL